MGCRMPYSFPIIQINDAEKLWLKEVYDSFKKNEIVENSILKIKLWDSLPKGFNPKNIDIRLLRNDGITLLGIWHIDPGTNLVGIVDRTIKTIRGCIIKNPKEIQITCDRVSSMLNISPEVASQVLKLIGHLGTFWSGASCSGAGYSSISINREDVIEEYLNYEGIEEIMKRFYNSFNKSSYQDKYTVSMSPSELNPHLKRVSPPPVHQQVTPIFRTEITDIDLKLCFVLMPFKQKWSNRVYKSYIKENVEKIGLKCQRADNLTGQIIIEDIWAKINECAFIIADVTKRNPNVMYELGIVHTLGKPAILITQDLSDIPFDCLHLRHHEYKDDIDGCKDFSERLPIIIKDIYKKSYNMDI